MKAIKGREVLDCPSTSPQRSLDHLDKKQLLKFPFSSSHSSFSSSEQNVVSVPNVIYLELTLGSIKAGKMCKEIGHFKVLQTHFNAGLYGLQSCKIVKI